MIKKISASFLILLYAVTAVGFALNLHYCCDSLASVKINAPAAAAKTCKMACSSKCCRDKHIEIKVKDAHQSQSGAYFDKLFAFQLPLLSFPDFFYPSQRTLFVRLFDKSPPDKTPNNSSVIFIKNRVFRI
jgi:hypothetical protein